MLVVTPRDSIDQVTKGARFHLTSPGGVPEAASLRNRTEMGNGA